MDTKEVSNKVSENISRYYQKQYERFINSSKKGDIQGAFFESTPETKYEDLQTIEQIGKECLPIYYERSDLYFLLSTYQEAMR